MEGTTINIYITTMGCAKNAVDSEHMAGYLSRAGHRICESLDQAEAAIINTCGFIQPAVEENIEAILELIAYKESGKLSCLIVAGCLSQRYQRDLAAEFPEVDGFVGTGEYERIAMILEQAMAGGRPESYQLASGYRTNLPRVSLQPGPSAYLKVAEGCPRRCSYCVIPTIRGPLRSRQIEEIVTEAEALVAQGVKEIILVAQDTTAYGLDLAQRSLLPNLLNQLADIPELAWIRFLYAYPELVDDRLLTVMARQPKVCPYLDLPLQHISPRILRSMGRSGGGSRYLRLIEQIRRHLPRVALHSTFIVGYPGETEAEFAELLEFVDEVKFNQLAVFTFYPEEGTKAATLPDQVPSEIARERMHRLTDLQAVIAAEQNQLRVGTLETVLVESVVPSEQLFIGRSKFEAPEIDAVFSCQVKPGERLPQVGEIVRVRITDADSQILSAIVED